MATSQNWHADTMSVTMAQFDVHPNPIPGARRAYPWVVVLQSELAGSSGRRIVAPMAPRAAFSKSSGRLVPFVRFDGGDYAVLVPALTSIASRELVEPAGSLADLRSPLLAAVDYLFFGV